MTSLAWSKISGAPAFLTNYTETDPVFVSHYNDFGNWTKDKSSYITLANEQADNLSLWNNKLNMTDQRYNDTAAIAVVDNRVTSVNATAVSASSLATTANANAATALSLATTANATASAALPKAGGTMTGAINMGGSQDITHVHCIIFESGGQICSQ
jgi:hypothetical protein